jgi:hypothetical protein
MKYILLILLIGCKAPNIHLKYPLTIRRVDCTEGKATYYLQQVDGIEEAWFVAKCGEYEVGDTWEFKNK